MAEAAQELIPLRVKGMAPARERLAAFLRAEHPRDTVAHVQTALAGVGFEPDKELVKAWVAGRGFPTRDFHLDPLIAAYGKGIVLALWGSLLATPEELEQLEIERARQALASREARLEATRANRRKFLGVA